MALAQLTSNLNLGLIAEIELGLLLLQGLLLISSVFLMLLVLVQRGKGGGLTGALGGMGGQSAFGSKAGDAFTKITVITAAIWIFLCMLTIATYNPPPRPKTAADKADASGVGAVDEKGKDNGVSATGDDKKGADGTESDADGKAATGDDNGKTETDNGKAEDGDPSTSVSVDSDGNETVTPNLSEPDTTEKGDSGSTKGSDGDEANEKTGESNEKTGKGN